MKAVTPTAMLSTFTFTVLLGSPLLAAQAEPAPASVEACARLLPPGKDFKLNMYSTIDTNGSDPKIKVKVDMSDGSKKEDPALKTAVKPFLNCVMPLMKAGVKPL